MYITCNIVITQIIKVKGDSVALFLTQGCKMECSLVYFMMAWITSKKFSSINIHVAGSPPLHFFHTASGESCKEGLEIRLPSQLPMSSVSSCWCAVAGTGLTSLSDAHAQECRPCQASLREPWGRRAWEVERRTWVGGFERSSPL